jgi:hypothetical protein
MRTAIPTALVLLSLAAGCGSNGSANPGGGGGGGGGGTVEVNLDGGGTPAVPPNGAAACPAGACNYQTGSGCSGATPACAPVLSGTTTISPTCIAPGAIAPGGACTNPGDCTAGYLCGAGVCRKLCCGGDWTGCDSPTEHCLQNLEYQVGSSNLMTGAMLCGPVNDCNALEPSTCTTAGTSCQIADLTGATACLPQGTGTSGQPCPCQGGFTCVTPAGKSPVCVRLCAAVAGGAEPYCQASEGICTHYWRDPAGVGECQPP